MATYTDDLALAHVLADTADSISLGRFKALDLRVDSKPDMTPVSDADTAVEKAIESTLARTRPRDGLLGEEFGERSGPAGNGQRRWVVDPIDGTANYVRGVPVWATLIALLDGNEPVVGLVSAPAMRQRWWAARGGGAYTGRQRSSATAIKTSAVTNLSDASLSYSSISDWYDADRGDAFMGLTREVWRTRAYGDFYSYVLLAEGALDVAIEPEVSLWDLAALVPIITEAGGRFTDLSGQPGPHGGSAVATNGHLHTEVLAQLTPSQARSAPPA
ncbi:histidinol-phosphatase [Fodinicola feengrottensis]|uniref:Histidinol-phosphatase n=1 Tax=Fodinicola feengrottensis TaxID=435914 RepID=A0ABN2GFU6_9ACTN|nr:histidinol-phosphatase [Fodinicola feengrottensis]